MNTIWYSLYLGAFAIIALFVLFYRNMVKHQPHHVKLEAKSILVVGYFCYSASLPVSRLFFGTVGHDFDFVSLRMHLFGFLGLALGAVISVPLGQKLSQGKEHELAFSFRHRYAASSLRMKLYVVLLGAFGTRYIWILFQALNFDLRNIFRPYGFETLEGLSQTGIADVFVYFGLYGMLIFGLIWHHWVRRLPIALSAAIYSCIGFLAIFWLIRGSRNMTILLCLPAAAVLIYRRKIRLPVAFAAGIAVIALFYLVAGLRSLGLDSVSRTDVVYAINSFDPLNGELGTSYSVLERALGLGTPEELLLGKSYTIELLLNLVPRSWWPDRPDNLAISFSKRYFNTEQLTEGLGFSPILEAYLNFGRIGIVGVFFIFYILVVWLEDRCNPNEIRNVMLVAFAMPIIINWNRIDSSTAFKMYSGFIFISCIIPILLVRDRMLPSRPAGVRLLPRRRAVAKQ